MKNKIQKYAGRIASELMLPVVLVNLFLVLAWISPITQKNNVKWQLVDGIAILLLDVFVILAARKRGKKERFSPGQLLKENRLMLLIMGVVLLSRCFMIGTQQRWDAGEYYYRLGTACQRFDFSPITFLAEFRICGHSTLAMSFFGAMGEFLSFRNPAGVQMVVLILTACAMGCLYQLFQGFFCKVSKERAAIGTLLCSCVPLFWGSFAYLNPDYFVLLFFLFLLYAEFKKKYVLAVFWGICMTQAKEPGIILLFGYMVFRLFRSYGGNVRRWIRNQVKDPMNWAMVLVGCCFLVYLTVVHMLDLQIFGNPGESSRIFTWSEEPWNGFGFDSGHIGSMLKQLFVINFSWLMWGGLAVLVVYRRKSKGQQEAFCEKNRLALMGAMVCYLVFTCLYVTWDIYRYHETFVFGTALLFVSTLLGIRKKEVFAGAAAVLLLLLGTQSFVFLDPVTNLVFPTVSTGKGQMLYSSRVDVYYGDFLVNNYRYAWVDKALDAFLEEIDYREDMQILLPDSQTSGLQLNGNGESYVKNWNLLCKERTMMEAKEHIIPISTIAVSQVDRTNKEMVVSKDAVRELAYLLLVPYYEYEEEELLRTCSDYYEVGAKKTVVTAGGQLTYYPLIKRGDPT